MWGTALSLESSSYVTETLQRADLILHSTSRFLPEMGLNSCSRLEYGLAAGRELPEAGMIYSEAYLCSDSCLESDLQRADSRFMQVQWLPP